MARSDYAQTTTIHNKVVDPSNAQSIVESIVPIYTDDTKKAKYLSFRVANFSVIESCKLAKIHIKSVRRWRELDPAFYAIDVTNLENIRKELSAQFTDIEFTRNFRLVLAKDFEILSKSMTEGQVLNEFEENYLLKLRAHYTPQSLAMVKQLLKGGTISEPFNFTKYVLTLTREKETAKIEVE